MRVAAGRSTKAAPMWSLPLEKLPAWVAGSLFAMMGIALLAWRSARIDGRTMFVSAQCILCGLAIVAIDVSTRRREATWRGIVERLREHAPLMQWSTGRRERIVSALGDAGFSDTGPRTGVAFDEVVVLGDCTFREREFRCDLPALRESLQAPGNLEVRPATPDGRLSMLPDVPALLIRIRPWPRWLERIELTDEEKAVIEKRRLP